jgi:sulfur relay protein TusB/DsrH
MSCLHTVNKTSSSSNALSSCLRVASDDDCILLIEDGVYNVIGLSLLAHGTRPATIANLRICALKEDLDARGIHGASIPAMIATVSYDDFVQLACKYQQFVSWF